MTGFVVPDYLEVCRCGHLEELHRHFHAKTYCAWCCDCRRYRPPGRWATLRLRLRGKRIASP